MGGPGGSCLRALCGPQGAAGTTRRQNAPRRPAAMAGEAHPVPSRTRKLSPRAPIVLRGKPVGDQDAAGRLGAFSPGGAPRRARGPFFRGPVEPGPGTCVVQGPFHNLGGGRVLRSAEQTGKSCPAAFTWGRPAANTCRARGALSRLRHKLAPFLRRASTTRDPIGPRLSCAFS